MAPAAIPPARRSAAAARSHWRLAHGTRRRNPLGAPAAAASGSRSSSDPGRSERAVGELDGGGHISRDARGATESCGTRGATESCGGTHGFGWSLSPRPTMPRDRRWSKSASVSCSGIPLRSSKLSTVVAPSMSETKNPARLSSCAARSASALTSTSGVSESVVRVSGGRCAMRSAGVTG